MNTGIIIQARVGSKRLPNKIVTPFYDQQGILEIIIREIRREIPEMDIFVATTENPDDIIIVNLCKKLNISYFRGSEENVLKRFVDCATHFELDNVVRICSDNVFINLEFLKDLIEVSKKSSYDYISFMTVDGTPSIRTHFGLWAEFVTIDSLKKIQTFTNSNVYLEHVTNYIYQNHNLFNIKWLEMQNDILKYKFLRFTLDTQNDFDLLKDIYITYVSLNKNITELLKVINENNNWKNKMLMNIQKNGK